MKTLRMKLANATTCAPFPAEAVEANHLALVARNASNRRFGYDSEASVRFVVEKALPLCGHVLDIGTGKGRFVIPLAQHLAKITTVDINAGEQRVAQLEASYAGVAERIDFVVADARALPWRAGSYDAVTSWNVFHHLDDAERVLQEMLRVLRPGGKLVLADFSPSGFRIMDEIHAAEGRQHPHPPSQFPHWRAILRNAGFEVRRFVGHHQEVLVANHSEIGKMRGGTRSTQDSAHGVTRSNRLRASRKPRLCEISPQTKVN
jgi:ubiquinone/menaquinone biosynthesis C-methylase UbiE